MENAVTGTKGMKNTGYTTTIIIITTTMVVPITTTTIIMVVNITITMSNMEITALTKLHAPRSRGAFFIFWLFLEIRRLDFKSSHTHVILDTRYF
ncbi:hypothetical protein [Helicobacter cynogastricus]|uniref:OMP1515 n=1 Tax=Helicobacter cynogastricus TaxID=329937 RepID=A0A1R3UCU8_9HELI|nr:hypothetical protein [Helicobacter cynogastricus]SFZ72185.1 OMP1515 [Helicobacter cynogastricus]